MATDRDPDGERLGDGPPGGRDPRSIVTPYAFGVADELMGTPLATPWRRAAAVLVDLVAVLGVVVLREFTGPLFLLLLAWFTYRFTTDRARNPVRGKLAVYALRAVAVVLLLVGVGQGIEAVVDGGDGSGAGRSAAGDTASAVLGEGAASRGARVDLADLPGLVRGVSDLRSDDTARARVAAEQLGRRLRAAGMTRAEIRGVLRSAVGATPDSARRPAVRRAIAALDLEAGTQADSAGRSRADSLARAWAAALKAGDTAGATAARRELTGVLAADSVAELRSRVAALTATVDRMEDQLEEAEGPPGVIELLRGVARDLGFGFGTLGLYFTAFLALWDGHTPGKRLLGIRVARVNGEPLGWWGAFSRFGGYAASFATGLVGFLQILWDANRQGLHDRIAGTVVLREGPGPRARPGGQAGGGSVGPDDGAGSGGAEEEGGDR